MPQELTRDFPNEMKVSNRIRWMILAGFLLLVIVLFFISLMVGSSNMPFGESFMALFGQGSDVAVRIVQKIRLPETLAALIAGAGLSIAGLMMESTLKNPMASPSTLGVSNAAVFGANVSIIGFAGGFLATGNNPQDFAVGANPFATSSIAFIFAATSTLLVLALCSIRSFSSETVVLAGIALGTVWTAATTLLQFFATDVGLSAAIIWTFGDLSRATFTMDYIMLAVVGLSAIVFFLLRWRFNAVAADERVAQTLGVHVRALRFVTLFLSSLVTAVVVSYLGVIGFVGIICPHVMRRIVGNNHRFLIPGSLLCGSALLLLSNIVSHLVGGGTALPVGAITALLGGPFFLYLIFARKGAKA